MKIGKYDLKINESRAAEEYEIDILENEKYITEKVYNNYTRNHKKYIELLEFKDYRIIVKSSDYKKIITEVLQKYDSRNHKKELLDNINNMLYDFEDTLNDCYEIHNITELSEEQKEELNEIVKAAIRNYIEQL